ncbi:MAG: transketolase family protein, partial [Acidimicrobiales bacterium]
MTATNTLTPDMPRDAALEQLGINVIRGIAMDGPRAANSGHPGTAMALAPLAHVLFTRVMHHDPSEPHWPDRDRFVLSNGHASILLYSMLYLCGYGLTLDDLRAFRSFGSRTAGHPEIHLTPGLEVTTGPLGQGFANGVGMGIAERWMRTHYSPEVVDHHTYVIAGDGCLEEGISHEAASLAGHLALGRLVYIYDNNHITIDGPTELSYSDDVAGRFAAYGWAVDDIGEVANDVDALEAALLRAKADEDRPSLIILRSHIGYPSPHMMDTAKAHGDPFPPEEIRLTKEILGLDPDETFWVPDAVLDLYRRSIPRGQAFRAAWQQRMEQWDGDKARWDAGLLGHGVAGWEAKLPSFTPDDGPMATRQAMKACLDATGASIPGIIPGSADLTGNTGMAMEGATAQEPDEPGGSLIHYGIREHGMGGVMTGIAAHGGMLPVGGTFFVFSDYMRGAVRVAAISGAHVVYSWTHDSVGLGEDGPTHQPVEQLAAMRAMPGLRVIRPADANECAHAWRVAVDSDGPTALVLSRQSLPVLEG